MSGALYIPAAYLITSKSQGIVVGTLYILLIGVLQVVFGYPFIVTYPLQYLGSCFNMNRGFDPAFSYNWNILPFKLMQFKVIHWILLALN